MIENEGRAYGHELRYGEIDLKEGGVLTAGISTAAAAIPTSMSVHAETLAVDATSQVTMAGRGYEAGGETEAGVAEASPGQTASTEGHGGSHGGAGGSSGAHESPGRVSGSTYDSAEDPTLPGGGGAGEEATTVGTAGGGVLQVTVKKLELDGLLSADGESGDGPTALEPAPFDFTGGAGAGGSVDVHADAIAGAGEIAARGGTACVDTRPPLLAGASGCGLGQGSGGGGGGGRVAVHATSACGWTGTLSAAGGVDSQSELHAEADEAEARRGAAGSVFFPAPAATCPGGRSEGGEAPGPPPPPPPPGEKRPEGSPPPSSAFTIVAHKAGKGPGAEVVTVAVPGPGLLSGAEKAVLKARRGHRRAKPEQVGSARASATAAGRVRLTFRLSAAGRAYLERHGRLVVAIRIAYTPAGGAAGVRTLTVTLKRR